MSKDLSRNDMLILISCGFMIVFALIIGVLIFAGEKGYCNTLEESFFGSGTIDHRSISSDEAVADRASTKDANSIAYESTKKWGNGPQTLDTSFVVTGSKGGYQDTYMVTSKAAGYGHTYEARKIKGDFSGSGNLITTETTLDSLILMDGNATFRGRVINGQTGRPVTESEMDAVGKMVIRSYLNVSKPINTTEGWLDFCMGVEQGLPADASLKIVPVNMTEEKPLAIGHMAR